MMVGEIIHRPTVFKIRGSTCTWCAHFQEKLGGCSDYVTSVCNFGAAGAHFFNPRNPRTHPVHAFYSQIFIDLWVYELMEILQSA